MENRGWRSDALVEFVDIYPTLSDLAGLPEPEGLEGVSFAPLTRTPERSWKSAAFSQYPRGSRMGYSLRTDRYHLVRWVERSEPLGESIDVELYDHENDPHETVNIAADPANAELVKKLEEQSRRGWKAARPPGF